MTVSISTLAISHPTLPTADIEMGFYKSLRWYYRAGYLFFLAICHKALFLFSLLYEELGSTRVPAASATLFS